MTHLSIRTLRRYHEVGLLEPEMVDASSGYRYYSGDQIPIAQVVQFERRTDKLARQACDHHLILSRGGLYPRGQIGRFPADRTSLFRTGRFQVADHDPAGGNAHPSVQLGPALPLHGLVDLRGPRPRLRAADARLPPLRHGEARRSERCPEAISVEGVIIGDQHA